MRFLEVAAISVGNNASERVPEGGDLGRKNFMFVGYQEGGTHLAGLSSLVATWKDHDVAPVASLTDVLIRVQPHAASRIDELLLDR